ncbi:fatty acyl-AMP ligase [Zooshikella ganghwensis]|uniref:AMP-dependent synthetase n=1 Tax=Zooshikella ganghwensis TaxID=202772 RepID=A0A4P9VTC3_9GAMM|nr:fatty acyl-AMP ligase [Zooshikella ganghwensis]RDH46416.1 AMP-dependent synthetase [Zooshikella ganghwensis]
MKALPLQQSDSLLSCLDYYAQKQPEKSAFSFLPKGQTNNNIVQVSYHELQKRAWTFANKLIEQQLAGKTALLVYPPGIPFIIALFGCFYAGVIAVPTNLARNSQHYLRLRQIANDSNAAAILAPPELQTALQEKLLNTEESIVLLHEPELSTIAKSVNDEINPEHVAFLQYTSGSTGAAKGVMITHHNLISNLQAIQSTLRVPEHLTIGGWLPQFHDMGLIGHILLTVGLGGHYIFMPPLSFIQRPERWLQLMSDYRAALSAAPNFAYELCLERVKLKPELMDGFDLSSWQWACNGAEPVSAKTIAQFSQQFAEVGFKSTTFSPCYGMAETTLMVSGFSHQSNVNVLTINKALLANENKVVLAPTTLMDEKTSTQQLVACGRVVNDHQVLIVNPKTKIACDSETVGEIWVQGASVGVGYWHQPEQTAEIFAAYTQCGQGPFLRTGDLGVLRDGLLYITGRLKDLIIVRGRNLYPQDIERTLALSSKWVRNNRAAAFALTEPSEAASEQVIAVQELEKGAEQTIDTLQLKRELVQAVNAEHDILLADLVFIRANSLPLTSSGKVQRRRCKSLYQDKALKVVA